MTTPAPATPPQRLLLSIAEVAAELGCGRDTVDSLLTSGALPSVRLGGRLRRIRRTDFTAYFDSLTASTPPTGSVTISVYPAFFVSTVRRPGIGRRR